METKTSKIKELTYVREFTGQFGKMFVYNLFLENGEYGEITTKDTNKYKVGDEIMYILEKKEYNGNILWKIKIQQPQKQAYSGGFNVKNDKDRELAIIRQSSLNRSIELVIANKINMNEAIKYAERFVKYVQTGS